MSRYIIEFDDSAALEDVTIIAGIVNKAISTGGYDWTVRDTHIMGD